MRGIKVGIDQVAYYGNKMYVGINGKATKATKMYMGDEHGKAMMIWKSFIPANMIILTQTTLWIPPEGLRQVDVCLLSGGNGGQAGNASWSFESSSYYSMYAAGGRGGTEGNIQTFTGVDIHGLTEILCTIGAGGVGAQAVEYNSSTFGGEPGLGGVTSFGSLCSVGPRNAVESLGIAAQASCITNGSGNGRNAREIEVPGDNSRRLFGEAFYDMYGAPGGGGAAYAGSGGSYGEGFAAVGVLGSGSGGGEYANGANATMPGSGGGGGGAFSSANAYTKDIYAGDGGNGASGLIAIRWNQQDN